MAEAVPLINAYRMQKQTLQLGVHLFYSDKVDLLVCGMGRFRMATGIRAYLSSKTPAIGTRWLNIGTAGALDHAPGDLVWARSIGGIDIGLPLSGVQYIPMDVVSLSEPSTSYVSGVLFDMEAQACVETLSENMIEFEPAHLFCAKVVSDNQLDPVFKKGKHEVTSLVQPHQKYLKTIIDKVINT